jgi:hypothetical protein
MKRAPTLSLNAIWLAMLGIKPKGKNNMGQVNLASFNECNYALAHTLRWLHIDYLLSCQANQTQKHGQS